MAPAGVATGAPSGVRHDHHESGPSLMLGLVEEHIAVLGERATVDVEQHRVGLFRIEFGRRVDPGVDLVSVRDRREPLGGSWVRQGDEVIGDVRQLHLLAIGLPQEQLGRAIRARCGERDHVAHRGPAGDPPIPAEEELPRACDPDPVQMNPAPVLHAREQGLVVDPMSGCRGRESHPIAIEARVDPLRGGIAFREQADAAVLREDLDGVVTDARDAVAVRRHARDVVVAGV